MSSVKYDEVACDNVVTNLENITSLLSDVNSDLERLVDALPSLDKIDNRIIDLSTKTRTNEDGTTEDYIDNDTKRYYEDNYRLPLLSAKTNIVTTTRNITSLNSSVSNIDERVRGIQTLIKDYEETPVEKREIDGLVGGESESVILKEIIEQEVEEGTGKTILNVDTDGDGKPDLNIDVDGDGKADLNIDVDSDGKPDLNIDVDGNGKADLNIDADSDGKPDYNIETTGDGKADLNLLSSETKGLEINIDLDGDGKADLNIDTNNDGKPDLNIDVDGDGKADYNVDTDNDGKPDIKLVQENETKTDTVITVEKSDTNVKDEEGEKSNVTETLPPKSNLFDNEDANKTADGFADNIIAGSSTINENEVTSEDGIGVTDSNGGLAGVSGAAVSTGATEATGSIIGTSTSGSDESESGGLFPFLPGSSSNSDGENSDLVYRALYDGSDEGFDMNQIKYNAIGEEGSTVAKGAAVVGAVGLGASSVDAVATLNENRKQEGDTMTSSEEKEEKKLIKTIVSSSILGLVSIGYIITLLMPNFSVFAIILLGVAMAISSVTATSGLKVGKYIGFGAVLFVSLLTFILSSLSVVSPIGYVVVFATFVILSIASILLDILKGMFDDKLDLVPIIIAIDVGLFFGMLKVLNIINWILLVILLGLTVGGYFLWDKVIKDKLPDDDDDEIVDNVIYKPVKYTENSPMNTPQQEKFDPRDLYKEDDAKNVAALNNMMNNQDQNPFANYNPKNSTFDNAFIDDNNNNNNNGMFSK